MNLEINNKLVLLKNSLSGLSKPYRDQVNLFPEYVDVFDEVITDFDNAFRLLPILMEARVISYEAVINILKCHNLIELNLTIDEMQTDKSFETDESWHLVRKYADNAVKLL